MSIRVRSALKYIDTDLFTIFLQFVNLHLCGQSLIFIDIVFVSFRLPSGPVYYTLRCPGA